MFKSVIVALAILASLVPASASAASDLAPGVSFFFAGTDTTCVEAAGHQHLGYYHEFPDGTFGVVRTEKSYENKDDGINGYNVVHRDTKCYNSNEPGLDQKIQDQFAQSCRLRGRCNYAEMFVTGSQFFFRGNTPTPTLFLGLVQSWCEGDCTIGFDGHAEWGTLQQPGAINEVTFYARKGANFNLPSYVDKYRLVYTYWNGKMFLSGSGETRLENIDLLILRLV